MNNFKKVGASDICIYAFISVISIVMLYPIWQTIVTSFMSETEYLSSTMRLFVNNPSLEAYKAVFENGAIFTPFKVTIFITIVGTIVTLFFTTFCAYGLSKEYFGSKVVMGMVVMSLFIKPGLIPEYLNLKNMGLLNSLSVYILPILIAPFYLIIMRTGFIEFPKELEESATIDGCGVVRTFFTIVLPLSKPILAAIGLFLAVNYWNTYMQSVFFISNPAKKTVQEYLNKLIADSTEIQRVMKSNGSGEASYNGEILKMANVVVIILPIILLYPFLQKYFVKGLMSGAVKG